MKTPVIIVCVLAVAASVIGSWVERRRLGMYWSRRCTGAQWKRRFPNAPKTEIREFLSLFVDAFAFRQSRRLCFAPDDRVMEVYRARHPPKWTLVDSLELETLAKDLRTTYGVAIVPLWREDITLGELFALTRPKTA